MLTIVGQKKGRKVKYRGQNGEFSVSVPLSFIVYDETGTASAADVLGTFGLPNINRIWNIDGIDSTLVCRSKEAEQWEGNNKYWSVNCELETADGPTLPSGQGGNEGTGPSGSGGDEDDPKDPAEWKPVVSLDYETVERPITSDIFGKPIINLAGRPYAAARTKKVLVPCIKFYQYEDQNLELVDIIARNESLNQLEFLGGIPGSWMLTIEDCDLVQKNGFVRWRVQYKIRYLTLDVKDIQDYVYAWYGDQFSLATTSYIHNGLIGGWNEVIPQEDYIDIEGNPVVDKNGNQIYGKLGVTGVRIPGEEQGTAPTIYIVHQEYKYMDFSVFTRIEQ